MPKKKITLEEAYAVFEQHGLEVEVRGIQQQKAVEPLSSFLEGGDEMQPPLAEEGKKTIKITLFAAHTIGNGGEIVTVDGEKKVVNNGIVQYGPGIVTVPSHLATHLLHQDLLARRADERMLEQRVRTYVVRPVYTSHGVVNVARHVSSENGFDLSGYLGELGNNGGAFQLG